MRPSARTVQTDHEPAGAPPLEVPMNRLIVPLVFVLTAATAAAQVTVQEYPLPSRLGAHDV